MMRKWFIMFMIVSMLGMLVPAGGYAASNDDTTLSSIAVSQGKLSPAFDPNTLSYNVNVYDLSSMQITATVTESTYALAVNGVAAVSGVAATVSLAKAAANIVEISVTSGDGAANRMYTLNIVNGPSPAEGTVNLASGKSIIAASSSLSGSEKMTDGLKEGATTSGFWQIDADAGKSTHFVLDLGAEYVLDDIVITRNFPNQSGHIRDAKIYGSTTTTFTTTSDLLAQTPNHANTDITTRIWEGKVNSAFAANKYRYLKFEKKDGWSTQLREIEVYGYPLPEIQAVNIADGSLSVPAASAFVIDFNKDMDTSLFTSAHVTVTEDGNPISYTPVYTARQLTIPSGTFTSAHMYTVTIPASLKDATGNNLVAGRTISFRTIDAERSAFYIAPGGNDANSGTIDQPFATIEGAKMALRAVKANMTVNYAVYLRGGVYPTTSPILLDDRDSGENGFNITYQAYPGETPIIDGGRSFSGSWEVFDNGMYRRLLDGVTDMRELYMNDARQPRASSVPFYSAPVEGNKREMVLRTADLPSGGFAHPEDLHYYQNHNWRTYIMPVQSLSYDTEYAKLHFREPHITTYLTKFNHEMKYDAWARLENALELVDQPGEWYFDKRTDYLYYKPAAGVDLSSALAYVPQSDALLALQGRTMQDKIHHVGVKGITFRGATWLDVNIKGFASTQTTYIVDEAGASKHQLPAGININHARDIDFERNVIQHFGKSGINMEQGIRDIQIVGNTFFDLSGGAITVGSTDHITIDPATEELPTNITISNNVLREIGVEFQSSAAINSAYSENMTIVHNDIDGVNYSGISVGWGFSATTTTLINTLVGYNKLQNFNRKTVDGAAIYSLSKHVNSSYRGNYVKNVNVPNNSGALYHDEQSRGFIDEDNVLEIERGDYSNYTLNKVDDIVIRNLYSTTGNMLLYKTGPGLVIEEVHVYPDANWPEPARQIIEQAGLEPAYRDLLEQAPSIPRIARPHVRSSGVELLQTVLFEPASTSIDPALYTAPHLEEGGIVVMEAKDYTGFVGLEASDYSFIGVLGSWLANTASKYTLLTRAKSFEREQPKTGRPALSYDVQFETPGTYYLLVRGSSQSPVGRIQVAFDGQSLGDMTFASHFTFVNEIEGVPVTVEVQEPGLHTVTLTALDQTVETYMDRVVLTQTLTEELYHGSTALGPLSSSKLGQPEVIVPVKQPFPSFMQTNEKNYSPGKIVSASSASTSAGAAVDESVFTSWRSAVGDVSPYWQIDLGEPMALYRLQLAFAQDSNLPEERRSFDIMASNDPDFTAYETLGQVKEDGIAYKSPYSVKPAYSPVYRYVRIAKTEQDEPLALSEVRIYSSALSTLTNVALGRRIVDASAPNDDQLAEMSEQLTDTKTTGGWTLTPSVTEDTYIIMDLVYPYSISELTLTRPNANMPQQISGIQVYGSVYSDFRDGGALLVSVPENVDTAHAKWTGRTAYSTDKYRYLKLVKQDQSSMALSEVEVWSKAPIDLDAAYVNVALNKPIVDVATRDANVLEANKFKLTDGLVTNWLLSRGTNPLPYYTVDLGAPAAIDKINLVREYPAVPAHTNNVVIIGDEDGDFSSGAEMLTYIPTTYNDNTSNVWSGYNQNPKAFRYYKVAKQANGDLFLREIELLVNQTRRSNAELKALSVSEAAVTPMFDPAITEYTVRVDEVTELHVQPVAVNEATTIRVNGEVLPQGTFTSVVPRQSGTQTITVEVTSENGLVVKAYTIIVKDLVDPVDPGPTDPTEPEPVDPDPVDPGPTDPTGPGPVDPYPVNPVDPEDSLDPDDGAAAPTASTGPVPSGTESAISSVVVHAEQIEQGTVQVEMNSTAQIELSQAMSWLEQNPQLVLEFKTPSAGYSLPLNLIDTKALAAELGVPAQSLSLSVTIEPVSRAEQAKAQQSAEQLGGTLLTQPIEFRLDMIAQDGRSIEVSRFTKYVPRSLMVEGNAPADQMVGVRIDPVTGVLTPVPTIFTSVNGKTQATLYRQGNSMYTVMQLDKQFADMAGHWAQPIVEMLASKMLVYGSSDSIFEPDKVITRAEFTAMLTRGLALQDSENKAPFTDVTDQWFSAEVAKAYGAGLIAGLPDGSFGPEAACHLSPRNSSHADASPSYS
jgi:hypothetical protein